MASASTHPVSSMSTSWRPSSNRKAGGRHHHVVDALTIGRPDACSASATSSANCAAPISAGPSKPITVPAELRGPALSRIQSARASTNFAGVRGVKRTRSTLPGAVPQPVPDEESVPAQTEWMPGRIEEDPEVRRLLGHTSGTSTKSDHLLLAMVEVRNVEVEVELLWRRV